ncbi:hypothetical protein [Rhodococcus sp. IEGM 1318]|uniref:hypothetical protein n=1 Tax=Rhodococcus sp. IEGM 1318 TaxID=3082226 RepID=UPI00295593F7|nr:hypothetical protein [Rhodococcus sp. IEGM 1318]MDV8009320.1 hypothetical protein [Rhodococcus sp. IEGM 1318]
MSDVYYNQVMHPLFSGYFETLPEVREVLEENRLELKDVSPEHREWRLVESYLDEGGLADRFHRLRYLDEDEDGPAERWAFSYSTPNDVLFNGVLIRDLETGEWD